MTLSHTFTIPEEDRQLILLALALMSLRRPGFEYAAREAAKRLSGEEMFDSFRRSNEDIETCK